MLLLYDSIECEVVAILLKSAKIAGLRISVLCQCLCLTGYDSKRYSLHYRVLVVQSFAKISCSTLDVQQQSVFSTIILYQRMT